ncbi:hypothetical protein R4K89_03605 [Brachyspira intermedia]|uniref:hypothetical protein n=1 Tax=Brachyspira intermedia TaxID=84377 RepID=UPI003005B86C
MKFVFNSKNFILLLLLIISILLSFYIQFYTFPKRLIHNDQVIAYYDMLKHYESGKLPVTGPRFIGTTAIAGYDNTARLPGGAFYSIMVFFYKLGNLNLDNARAINMAFSIFIIFLFVFWVYKRFGFFVSIVSYIFIFFNGYTLKATTDFWNPSLVLILSFITYMLFYEYISNKNENIKKLSAVFLFPFLAVMGQSHFATFFSFTSTLIVYLIIRFKYTKKYLLFWCIGVFISFLLYLPYLIVEIKNGFQNTMMILNTREGLRNLPFPQIWAVLLYPTNEMSTYFGSRLNAIIYFWFSKPPYIYGFIFLILSVLFSSFCFIREIIFLINKKYMDDIEKNLGEMFFLLLLSIPVTIISFIVFKSKSGTFWYLYSLFSFSFTPIFLFFYRIRNNVNNIKYLSIISLMLLLNIFAMSGELIRYVNLYEYSRDYNVLKEVAEFIEKDSQGKKVKVTYLYDPKDTYNDIFQIYFPEYDIQISEDPDIQYIIKDKTWEYNWDEERNKRNMQYIYDNNGKEITNVGAVVLYRCYD